MPSSQCIGITIHYHINLQKLIIEISDWLRNNQSVGKLEKLVLNTICESGAHLRVYLKL